MAKNDEDKKLAKPAPAEKALAQSHDYGEFAGVGYEGQSNEDIAMPFIGILQSLSPEVTDGDPKFMRDAKVGDLINTVTQQRYSGDKGVFVVPVLTKHVYVEWVPRNKGGGFVGIHELDSDIVKTAKATAENFNKLQAGENDLIESFYIYGLQLENPQSEDHMGAVVLAFTSTKIKVYKRIMTQLRTVKGNPPLFAHRLLVLTKGEKNKQNQPYRNFDIAPALGTVAESMISPSGDQGGLLSAAMDLHKMVAAGKTKVDYNAQAAGGSTTDGEEIPF